MSIKLATFGNGCFWCTEAIFQKIKGVIAVRSGFSGGHIKNPAYREVVTGRTGHAEVLHIEYDENEVSFEKLLEVFFATHDPTTLNRQGNDVGTQYRSAIFYHDEFQKEISERIILNLTEEEVYSNTIVTEVVPFETFFEAEEYHINYFELHKHEPYCNLVIKPKQEKFEKAFKEIIK
jgi:peptide-methionine (S)-S-oxide reductase